MILYNNNDSNNNDGEKETYKNLGILEADAIKQMNMKEKIKMSISDEQENFSKLGFAAGNKYLSGPLCKILGNILEMDEGRTSTNGPEDKKANDDA